MSGIYLGAAILVEVSATLSLRVAVDGRKGWYALVGVGYVLAYAFLSLALREGIGIGVAYGIWTASGVVLTAAASKFLFGETFNKTMAAGVGLIIAGVLLVELGGAR